MLTSKPPPSALRPVMPGIHPLDQALHQRQADPGSLGAAGELGLAAEEGLEELGEMPRCDAGTAVAHQHRHAAVATAALQ